MNTASEIDDILHGLPPAIRELALQTREFLLMHLPGCTELPDKPAKLIGYGFGTGYKDTICTLLISKSGVKIGFYRGAFLDDPDKLLEGTGKVHKYVAIKQADAINEQLRNLLAVQLKRFKDSKS